MVTNSLVIYAVNWMQRNNLLVNLFNQNGSDSLWGVFPFLQRHAVDKLYSTPESVELVALVNVHHAVQRHLPTEDGVIEETLDATHHHLKHRETTAQSLLCQQITIFGVRHLLEKR